MAWWAPLAGVAIGILRLIGRWVIRRIAKAGRRRILEYMSEKIVTFYERMRSTDNVIRRRWYAFRIRNWIRAKEWIKANWRRLRGRALRKLDDAIGELEDQVPAESFDKWRLTPEPGAA